MARTSQRDRVRGWQARIDEANRAHKKWKDDFRVDDLEMMYAGPGQEDPENPDKYIINKIFPTVETGIPSLLFYNPTIKIKPRPARADDAVSEIDSRAKLQEDTLNTFITDPVLNFKPITTLSLKESFFTYGIVEVGYTADLIDNPLLHKPELTDEEQIFAGLEKIPDFNSDQPERLYIKRIPAKNFRVPANSQNILEHNDWCGYFEWVRVDDVKANPRYKNTSGLRVGGRLSRDLAPAVEDESMDEEERGHRDMIKVWKIWDNRTMRRYVLPDHGEKFFIDGDHFDTLPFSDYRPHQMTDTFYPIPPVYNWLFPQQEMNDIRNKRKVHRKRFNRRYEYLNGSVDPEELEKLESDEDGLYIEVRQTGCIAPIADAPLDSSIMRDELVNENDFREITGIGGDQRGEASKNSTATQANIVEFRTRIRESYRKELVGEWIARMATIMLRLIRTHMALPFWIKMNVDPQAQGAEQEAMGIATKWLQIVSEDLGDLQLDISVDVISMSPLSEEGERAAWTQVLMLFTQPQLLAVLLSSDVLLKKTLQFYNVRSQGEIDEIKKAGMQMVQMVASMAAAQNGAAAAPDAGQGAAPGPTPGNMGIRGQLAAQMGVA
jgi:hypothetical protein